MIKILTQTSKNVNDKILSDEDVKIERIVIIYVYYSQFELNCTHLQLHYINKCVLVAAYETNYASDSYMDS